MAKIGYMMLKKGKWRGIQIVSEEWVNESTKAHVQQISKRTMASDYGYQWHHGERKIRNQNIQAFFAQGMGGQYIFVIPALDLVVVFTHQHKNSSGWINGHLVLAKYIIPSVLPPAPLYKAIELDSKIIDKYLGEYESRSLDEKITVGKKNGSLYIQRSNVQKVTLYPETKNIFYGTSEEFGELQITFSVDTQRSVKHLILRIGFMGIQFDKTN
jgi:hypothetical protein